MSDDTALQIQEQYELPQLTAAHVQLRQSAIIELLAKVMKRGDDYGRTFGKKDSLYKAGSEKILSMFQLAVEPIVEELTERTGRWDEFRVRVYVALKDKTGRIVGKGLGEASSWEEKYMWRAAVNVEEHSYMQGLSPDLIRVKFGNDYKTKKPYQIKQVRVPTADIANTVIKMAKKRAQIDATLTATAASAIFTQDFDDLPEELAQALAEAEDFNQEEKPERVQPKRKEEPKQEEKKSEPKQGKAESKPVEQDPDLITPEQRKELWEESYKAKLSQEEVQAKFRAEFKDKQGKPLERTSDMLKVDFKRYMDSLKF